jgi:8-oxo-dGTP diphosphatase
MILFIIAVIMGVILYPLGILYSVFKMSFTYVNALFKTLAIGINQFGNVTCADLFNDTLRQKNGYKFGNPDDTISRVLGMNKKFNTLTKTGKFFADVLNFIDKNHVENAAK